MSPQHPGNPYPYGHATNCKREGWNACYAGKSRDACPFPPARDDLRKGYQEGWDAAHADLRESAPK